MRIHDRNMQRGEDAFTGLELVVLITVLAGISAFLLIPLMGGGPSPWVRTFPEGPVAESVYQSGDHLQPVGNIIGFPAVNGPIGNVETIFRDPDPGMLGAVRITTSLFMGDTGAIDMDRVTVIWTVSGSNEELRQTYPHPLVCPNWTITRKYNLLPGRTADSDNWLEPGEQFEILACPSTGVKPYGIFTLIIHPDGSAMPLRLTRTVPSGIAPVMNLR